jgi:hypothetical protein
MSHCNDDDDDNYDDDDDDDDDDDCKKMYDSGTYDDLSYQPILYGVCFDCIDKS